MVPVPNMPKGIEYTFLKTDLTLDYTQKIYTKQV